MADRLLVDTQHQELFDERLAQALADNVTPPQRHKFWLSHHWPTEHSTHCVKVAGHPVCRRCLALHPIAIVVAVAFAFNVSLWPTSLDPAAIWLLSIPATIAFAGEGLGLWAYNAKWQAGTTLIAAFAFGRALGYELVDRWHPNFWLPLAVFGGVWFITSALGHQRRSATNTKV